MYCSTANNRSNLSFQGRIKILFNKYWLLNLRTKWYYIKKWLNNLRWLFISIM